MKKHLLVFLIAITCANANAQLKILNFTGIDYVGLGDHVLINFYNLNVQNTDSVLTFTDSINIDLGVEDPPAVITNVASVNLGPYTILPLDSVIVDTVIFDVDTTFLKDGNNTVVIWPYGTNTFITAFDSLTEIIFIPVSTLAIPEQENGITITAGPNPTRDLIFLYDPQAILQQVQVRSLEGKRIPVRVHGNVVDVSKLPAGVFILEIQTVNGILTRKIIVEK
ncbi:MAG TPA: T9SS type A sorting domain-containing protein [Flavobacteriales bacterium]|nr:T9SS type A sorting domain-containing protein [Flavobacteriales bacterium]